jgi:hypothetical protein
MKTAAQPTAPASVGVAMPIRITPSVAMMTTITGTTPITRSLTTAVIEVARISGGSAGPSAGLSQQRTRHQAVKMVDSSTPGITAAANRSVAGTPTTGPITISITEGGIRMPSVPPAAIAPALILVS